ncbi:hypothetical protein FM996_04430 [Methylosinus sporium]|uniref:Uncharacterized protein n=1 Tax=Methylosinus sporium TaxID=428 RepID=A0A549T3W0_METSR|nr:MULTISPECIES: hypothetical protein [Methylosinus]MBU3886890.1 hypothetical protein [Methylosinus sp. KRF6]TRL36514.1 hypothetical protein FM996_04430 [Methylosinus sporium]
MIVVRAKLRPAASATPRIAFRQHSPDDVGAALGSRLVTNGRIGGRRRQPFRIVESGRRETRQAHGEADQSDEGDEQSKTRNMLHDENPAASRRVHTAPARAMPNAGAK